MTWSGREFQRVVANTDEKGALMMFRSHEWSEQLHTVLVMGTRTGCRFEDA